MTCFSAVYREIPEEIVSHLSKQGIHPLMAKLYAARGVNDIGDIGGKLSDLLSPALLTNSDKAAQLLADAILMNKKILVIGDYDCDGATSTAVAVGCLREFGARVDYLIPNRLVHGYGLSEEIARLAIEKNPDWVITVDNGINDIAGVALLKQHSIAVIITDHHIEGDQLPDADAIVNPHLHNCQFPSKCLAGVGVIFYVMMQLRTHLRKLGFFASQPEPNLAYYLDLVALGTIADVMPLDKNNRILVAEGIHRIRSGKAHPGLMALLQLAGRNPLQLTTEDFGFCIAPRLNAAGRLGDMALSVACLLETDEDEAAVLASKLEKLNRTRQSIQEDMLQSAEKQVLAIEADQKTLVLYHNRWHEGIIGIIAGRLKDRHQKPVFVFASGQDGLLKGSGRSVLGIHLHAVLSEINQRCPELLLRFGGHAAAAGVTIHEDSLSHFENIFESVVVEMLSGQDCTPTIHADGSLDPSFCILDTALMIENQVWGPHFPMPVFVDHFEVEKTEIMASKHLRLKLRRNDLLFDAVQFNTTRIPENAQQTAYRLTVNRYQGKLGLKLQIEGWIDS